MKSIHSLDAALNSGLRSRRMARLNILRGAALLILFAVVSFIASAMTGESVEVTAMATLPFLGLSGFLMDKEDDHGGGGGDPDAEKILRKIQETRDATETLSKNFGSLDKEAKELAEEQAKIAKNFDGLTADVKAFQNVIAKMEAKIRNERRSNGMSAIQRIQGDTELRNTVNNIARAAYMMARHKSLAGASEELLAAHKMMQGLSGKTVTSGSEPGSTYINDALIPELYSLVAEYGIWSGFDVIRAGTKTTKLLVRGADPVMSVVDEGVAPDEATVAGTSVSSTVKKMLGWVGVANEMLEDAETDVSGILLEAFANATAYRLDWFCTQADGGADATDGGMTGIFGGGGTAAVAASGNVSIATHDFEDWIKPMTVVDAMVLTRGGARWWIHPTLLAKVLGVKDANGRSIFLPSTEAPSFGAFGSIFGFPIQLAHAAPSADTTSSKIAVFGDPRGQAVLLRKDMEFVSSDQAKFLEDETVFRCRARGATKIRKATAFGVLTNAAS